MKLHSTLIMLSCILMIHLGWANPCANSFHTANSSKEISSISSFFKAMTQGAVLSKAQSNLFDFYMRTSYSNYQTIGGVAKYYNIAWPIMGPNPHNFSRKADLDNVLSLIQKYGIPEKLPLREYTITSEKRIYPSSKDLIQLIKNLKKSAGQIRNNLFNVSANLGFWKIMLDFPMPDLSSLNKQDQKRAKKQNNQQFKEYLDSFMKNADKNFSQNNIQDVISLYQMLNATRDGMIKENKNIQKISQAMADLIHTAGFSNKRTNDLLNSGDTLQQIQGIRQILQDRDSLSYELGFEGHFQELTKSLDVVYGSDILQQLTLIEKSLENESYTTEGETSLRVRSLSLQESPFRGCLGGDCSSSSYFEKGLDPNFIYFTLTNAEFQSSGHITVVLGTAKSDNQTVQTAFVDKIQNIPNQTIIPMLSALRLSLKEQGYLLALSERIIDDANGLSNMADTREYVQSEIIPYLNRGLADFQSHPHKIQFDNGYSTAYDSRFTSALLEFKDIKNHFKIEPGPVHQPKNLPEDLTVQSLIKSVLNSKHSRLEKDQIDFLISLPIIISIPEANKDIDWAKKSAYDFMSDSNFSFKVRKRAFFTLLELEYNEHYYLPSDFSSFFSRIKMFSLKEQMALAGEMSNWSSSSRWKSGYIDGILFEIDTSWYNDLELKSVIRLILKKVINAPYEESSNPLSYTIKENLKNGYIDDKNDMEKFTQDFIEKGLNPNDILNDVIHDLWDGKAVQILINKGANVNVRDEEYDDNTPLFQRDMSKEAAQVLIDNGADINVQNAYDNTPLHLHVYFGNLDIVKLLIENKANVNARNDEGNTPLFYSGSKEADQILIDNGADVNAKNNDGDTYSLTSRWHIY